MPTLALLYVLFLCLNIIDSFCKQMKRKEPAWYIAIELIFGILGLAFFIGYWVTEIVRSVSTLGLLLFLLCWIWMLSWAPHEVRSYLRSARPEREKKFFLRFGFWLESALMVPALWFGARAVMRGL